MTGPRENILLQAVDTLLDARRTNTPIPDLPADLIPADMYEVAFVQDAIAAAFGPIGGYKIGAATPDATPAFAPMPSAWMAPSGSTLSGPRYRFRGVECEIAFLVGNDLPPRNLAAGDQPYTREEALAAMASCHPAIEVLESAFIDPMQATKLAYLADLQMHGGFVYGPEFQAPGGNKDAWRTFDFSTDTITLAIDGVLRVERTGSNTSGDLLKLIPWLANQGAARTGGLKAGQWITTGSWTGYTLAPASATVAAHFQTAGKVDLRYE